MACTTILVGKNASYDGSTLMARNEDSPSGEFTAKKFISVNKGKQPRSYRSVLSKFKIKLPANPLRYTAMPNAIDNEGIWGEAGINELNVAMSETETITSNPRVLGADPLVKDGFGEEDMLTIVLPYIKSAREGVLRFASLLEEYGTYEMNGVGFQDKDEVWWLETIGGHHWIAKRVPDDAYVVMPNQQGIDFFDFVDAFSKKENHMCSKDMLDFIKDNHLDLGMHDEGYKIEEDKAFDIRAALGSHDDSDHTYNTPRAWFMARYLNPTTYTWDGEGADYTPESDDIPWSFVPEKKITIEDVKYVLSSYYQGTPYNPYGKTGDLTNKGKYRPIGISRNNFLAITQLRPYMPKEFMALEWISVGSNAFNVSAPFYANVNRTPDYLANTTARVSTDNYYWSSRLIGAMADAHYNTTAIHIERYQNKVHSKGHEMINAFDKELLSKDFANISRKLANCNDAIAEMLKKETDDALDKVLYTASCGMKNSFARSDA